MDELEYYDIGYKYANTKANYYSGMNTVLICFSFLVGGDGNVYEGVGFHKVGAHTRGYNTRSLGIAFIGNFQGITTLSPI